MPCDYAIGAFGQRGYDGQRFAGKCFLDSAKRLFDARFDLVHVVQDSMSGDAYADQASSLLFVAHTPSHIVIPVQSQVKLAIIRTHVVALFELGKDPKHIAIGSSRRLHFFEAAFANLRKQLERSHATGCELRLQPQRPGRRQ